MSEPSLEPNIDWEDVYAKLYGYADFLLRSKNWFRGKNSGVYLKGQEVHDYVIEAITRYLEHPEKFNPSKRSLVSYIKLHLIRTLVGDDAKLKENKLNQDVFAFADKVVGEGEDAESFLDTVLPFVEAFFDQEVDFEKIMNHIETEVKSDGITENIYLGICCYGMKRREVIKEFSMTESEFDNGMRRLKTILKNTVATYGIKAPSL